MSNPWTNASMRVAEKGSIERFIADNIGLLDGDVLDYGCGKQPYRKLVTGVYTGYDRFMLPGNVGNECGGEGPLEPDQWDAIICTQVIQYHPIPGALIEDLYFALRPGGWLLLTGPTNWPEVETEDLWRFTISGVNHLLRRPSNPFTKIGVYNRGNVYINDIVFSLGWAARAKR